MQKLSHHSCRMLKKTTPGLGNYLSYTNRLQRFWLVLSVALVLGLGAFAWLNQVLVDPPMAAVLTVCAMVLIGPHLVLSRRLQLMRTQRDQALAQVSATEWQMCVGLRNQDPCMTECAARRVQALQSEIADLHIRKQLLQIQAHHDSLTGLANRLLLAAHFHFAVERAKRSGKSFALLMIDLNDFKSINDTYGHVAGDAVLVAVAKRLVGAVRASDTVARLGGDEFVLITEAIENPQELAHISEKLFDTLSDTITLDTGALVNIGASIGVALYPDDGADMNDLLHVADLAMYKFKSTGLMPLQSDRQ